MIYRLIFGTYFVIDRFIYIYIILIVISAFLSWIPQLYNSKFGLIIQKITSPFYNLTRRFIPPIMGIDISPIIGIILLEVIQRLLGIFFNFLLARI